MTPTVTYRPGSRGPLGTHGLIGTGGRRGPSAELYHHADGSVSWHTFDRRGIGGENDTSPTLQDAKREACLALLRQHAYPGGRHGGEWRIPATRLTALLRLAWSREGLEQRAIDETGAR